MFVRYFLVALYLVGACFFLLQGCAGFEHNFSKPSHSKDQRAKLEMKVTPDDAKVYVDEVFFGTAKVLAVYPGVLDPGYHQITVIASGYFPHDFEVNLKTGLTKVDLKLRPIPEL